MQNTLHTSRLVVVTGGFGSGKSEFAINLALAMAETSKTVLVDLDLVNAYFRSREAREFLAKYGVKAVVPSEQVFNSDLPIAGPGVNEYIKDQNRKVILDVGGDDSGASALGTYKDAIKQMQHLVLMVVNPYRPFSNNIRRIGTMKNGIEYSSRLKVDAIIANPNIGPGTNIEHIQAGLDLLRQSAQEMKLPILELLVLDSVYARYDRIINAYNLPIRPVSMHLTPNWLWNSSI